MILLTGAAVPLLCAGALLAYDLVGWRTFTTGAERFQIHAVFAGIVLVVTALLAFASSRLLRELSDKFSERLKLAQQQHGSVQAHLSRMHLLQRISCAIGEQRDLQSMLHVVLQSVEDDLPADFCCLCVYDDADETLTVAMVGSASHTLAVEMGLTEDVHVPIDAHGLARSVKGALVYESDTRAVGYPFPQRLATAGICSAVIAPIKVDDRVFALLIAGRRVSDGFISADCEFLQHLCEQVGNVSRQSQVYGSLQRAYDDLCESQSSLLQQERLRALGQMASGIAHDINNALAPVILYSEALLDREPDLSDRARSYLQTIQRAVDDVAQTVARMREFYRPRDAQLVPGRISINTLVDQVLELSRPRWGAQPIELLIQLDPSAPEIVGAEAEVRDALTHLVVNAIEAMPKGGTLTVSTCAVEVPWHAASDEGIAPRVYIEVSDTGVGMNEDARRRCLEPFFSTKGERGAGLGLSMVYGMAQRHGAALEIESTSGSGTTVRLVFARHEPGAVAVPRLDELSRHGEASNGGGQADDGESLTAMQGRG